MVAAVEYFEACEVRQSRAKSIQSHICLNMVHALNMIDGWEDGQIDVVVRGRWANRCGGAGRYAVVRRGCTQQSLACAW